MKIIPLYQTHYAMFSGKDGNHIVEIFADFISQLLEQDDKLSTKEKRLVEEIEKNGTELLNENQMDLLTIIVKRYEKKCGVCNSEIPLNEVFHLGKYCSNHDYLNNEEK